MANAQTQEVRRIEPSDIENWLFERSSGLDPDSLEGLAEDMASGQAEAIVVRPVSGGLQGVTGERRAKAVERFGHKFDLSHVRTEVRDMSRFEAIQTRVHSNLDRCDDTIYDQGELCALVADEMDDPTHTQIGEVVGKSRSWVTKAINRLDDPPEVREAVENGDLSGNAASAVAQESDPEVRGKVLDRVSSDSLNEEEAKDALADAREDSGLASDVTDQLNRIEANRERVETARQQVESKEETEAEIANLEEERDEIWENAPKQAQDRMQDFRNKKRKLEGLEAAISAVSEERDRLRDASEEASLSEAESTRLTDKKERISDLQEEIGDPTITEQGTDDEGRVSYQINVSFDPDDPPEFWGDFLEAYHDLEGLKEDISPLEAQEQKSEALKADAREIANDVSVLQDTHPDFSTLPENVRDAVRSNSGEGVSSLEGTVETLQEEIEATDPDDLQEAVEALGDAQERAEEIAEEIEDLRDDLRPLNGAEGRLGQAENSIEEARQKARDYFAQMDEETAEAKLPTWEEAYDFDLGFLTGESPEETDFEIIDNGGGWYTVVSGDGTEIDGIRTHETAEEIAQVWESDGFEAAQEEA